MKILDRIAKTLKNISYWIDRVFDRDQLTIQPSKMNVNKTYKEELKELRRIYRSHHKKNIAITGGKAVGKKSLIMKFEDGLFPVGKFIHIDFREFSDLHPETIDPGSLQEELDNYILNYLKSRARQGELPIGENGGIVRSSDKEYRKPWHYIIYIIVTVIVFFYSRDKLADFVADHFLKTWKISDIRFAIGTICVILFVLFSFAFIKFIVAFWPFKRLKISISPHVSPVDLSLDANKSGTSKTQNEIIYVLKKLRYRIGHTVVFDNLGSLNQDLFQKAITHFSTLNQRVNEHVTAWRLWNIAPIKKPIRFIYIFRDDLVELRVDKPACDVIISVPPSLTVDNVVNELEHAFEESNSRGSAFPVEQLFPLDPSYEEHISRFITDRRILNMAVKRSVNLYKDFKKHISPSSPNEKDISRLFSFALFCIIFPRDASKFADNTSIVFTNSKNRENINQAYLELFEYLISDECPEDYRISYLCKRYICLHPELRQKHINGFDRACEKGDYITAVRQIEKAICCTPEDIDLIKKREEALIHIT